ncbi:TIGR03643 family protein [Dyadobacter sp. CY347]|uniref:TIGR03643 family protein n=1 Tax=Dyadobacter sp. CY347 TaxID=2909336 RepID=UPI001F44A839|nr:TIGR03643 family protein [Dyadobacter sp. CY347]MCF2489166.1 TIGR03643 family protein [Dyadobacter sp. CY347]
MHGKDKELRPEEIDRIVEMAWEDRTPFEAIEAQFLVSEQQVIEIMRTEMRSSSFRMWRKRVQGRVTKHLKLAVSQETRFKSNMQRQISMNKISKRVS